MSSYKTVHIETEVDVDLSYFETDDLLDELASRSSLPPEVDDNAKELIEKIWLKRRQGNSNYQEELDQLIYQTLGHIV
jgi:NH3-dependent NAD+ synthetase